MSESVWRGQNPNTAMMAIPAGIILPWDFAIKVEVPTGWGLCDGSASRPDLPNHIIKLGKTEHLEIL